MQKARRRTLVLRPLVNGLFTPLSGVLPTFPSRYWFAVGLQVVFSLAGWSPLIPAGFLVSCRTQVRVPRPSVARTGLSPPVAGLPSPFRFL